MRDSRMLVIFQFLFWMLVTWVCSLVKIHQAVDLEFVCFCIQSYTSIKQKVYLKTGVGQGKDLSSSTSLYLKYVIENKCNNSIKEHFNKRWESLTCIQSNYPFCLDSTSFLYCIPAATLPYFIRHSWANGRAFFTCLPIQIVLIKALLSSGRKCVIYDVYEPWLKETGHS